MCPQSGNWFGADSLLTYFEMGKKLRSKIVSGRNMEKEFSHLQPCDSLLPSLPMGGIEWPDRCMREVLRGDGFRQTICSLILYEGGAWGTGLDDVLVDALGEGEGGVLLEGRGVLRQDQSGWGKR